MLIFILLKGSPHPPPETLSSKLPPGPCKNNCFYGALLAFQSNPIHTPPQCGLVSRRPYWQPQSEKGVKGPMPFKIMSILAPQIVWTLATNIQQSQSLNTIPPAPGPGPRAPESRASSPGPPGARGRGPGPGAWGRGLGPGPQSNLDSPIFQSTRFGANSYV